MNAASYKQQGNTAFSTGNYQTAIELYTSAIDLDSSGDPAFYSNRAASYLKLDNFSQALEDCNTGLSLEGRLISESVKSKLYWRKATALDKLGLYELAIRTCNEGIKNCTTTQQLLELRTRISSEMTVEQNKNPGILKTKVDIVDSEFSNDFLTIEESEKSKSDTSISVTSSATPSYTAKFVPPPMPLSMIGLTQLLRTPQSTIKEAYSFFYTKINPGDLPQILGNAGLEPEFIDFLLDVLVSQYSNLSTWTSRSFEYLEIVASIPRFTIARMFSSESKFNAFKNLLSEKDMGEYNNILSKWL